MYDTDTLFHANHSNLGTGGAPSATTIGELIKLMKLQTHFASTVPVGIKPEYLIVPVALEGLAETQIRSMLGENPDIKIVSDPRLDGSSAAAYYLAAKGGLRAYFLNGQPKPSISSQINWYSDSLEYRVVLDIAAACPDWRLLAKNGGA